VAWRPLYIDVPTLAAYMLPAGQPAAAQDLVTMATAVSAASRAIDKACNRQFGLEAAPVDRFYTYDGSFIEGRPAVEIDDLMDPTDLEVALDTGTEGTYTSLLARGTDYDLWPRNASADGRPWTHIVLRRAPSAWFPFWAGAVRVSAAFGWLEVPAPVVQACLVQAGRFTIRRNSLYGVAGSPEAGNEMRLLERLDPDVAVNLASVRRWWGAVS
jgi:hypothetical protein